MSNILILIGTESGNAQMVAEAVRDPLAAAGHAVVVTDKAVAPADLEPHDTLLVVCATHGSGDIPSNMLPLHTALSQARPDLSAKRYGVIALGDMTYQDTFCGGGKQMDAVLGGLGAKRLGERLEVDASEQPLPDEEALAWVKEWVKLV
ncbi:MAG: flavodoxin domain-containing protein [Rhodospirillales bacterium]|nr:MAG: flavodoxin domain-containing protein [Rhodospirillales bacterium]